MLLLACAVADAAPKQGTWSPARLLADPAEQHLKEPRLAPSRDGGFHAVYRHQNSNDVTVVYRRYLNGALQTPVPLANLRYLWGGEIAEDGQGGVHVVWEHWDSADQQIWWAKSADGGVTFPARQAITAYPHGTSDNDQAKNPQIVPFGPASSAQMLGLSWRARQDLWFNRYNGTAWAGNTPLPQHTGDNRYAQWGAARHPDGSVYRTYSRQIGGVWQLFYRRFDGTSWGPEFQISSHGTGFMSRPAIAINESGQICVAWDLVTDIYCRCFDPAAGWGPVRPVDYGYAAAVTAVPGRRDFYIMYSSPPEGGDKLIHGRRVLDGNVLSRKTIQNGLPPRYQPNGDICAGVDGKLYVAWESWIDADSWAYFSILDTLGPAVLTVPYDGQAVLAAAPLTLTAAAMDPEFPLRKVEFFQGATKLGEKTAAPWTWPVANLPAGAYSFSVRAEDTFGQTGAAPAVTVRVIEGTAQTLVAAGATWKYRDSGDHGTAWQAGGYNDSAWPAGAAQLGYGDSDEQTLLTYGSDPLNKPITAYFRHTFNVTGAGAVQGLVARLLRDDGAAVYLNGQEVVRDNLADGATAAMRALTTVSDADESAFFEFPLDPDLLVNGTNVLAVEVHQVLPDSSDLSFALELVALRALPSAPVVSMITPLSGQNFLAPGSIPLAASATDPDDDIVRVEFFQGAVKIGEDTTAPYTFGLNGLPIGRYAFSARAIDSTNLTATSPPVIVFVTNSTTTSLVAAGAVWKYLANGTDAGSAWRAPGFSDATWPAGPAQLGFGEGDEATLIPFGGDPANVFRTTYFRRSFTVADPAGIDALTLRLLRDDGAAFYVNGIETFRSNLPSDNPLRFDQFAILPIGGIDENAWLTKPVSAGLLVPGTNVIAVEIHQATAGSSDLSFDLELLAVQSPDTDADGAPDDWEVRHGLNWQAADSLNDADGDGASSLHEYYAGTDPQAAADVFVSTLVRVPGALRLSVPAQPGRLYEALTGSNLTTWSVVPNSRRADVFGTGSLEWLLPPASTGGSQYYRVRVVP